MKWNLAIMSLFSSALSFAAPSIAPAPVKHLYVPSGYDNNDSIEVVVTGHFPNPCYSRNTVDVRVVDEKVDITITALVSSEKLLCPDMVVPFKEVVALGNLQGGTYALRVNEKLQASLDVAEAGSNSVDEHIYAAIDEIDQKGQGEYLLKGWRYSPCVVLDRVEVISNHKDTLSVLPIMKQISDFCPMKMMPVTYPVKLDLRTLRDKEPLIHVRTMDGKSVNTLVNMN